MNTNTTTKTTRTMNTRERIKVGFVFLNLLAVLSLAACAVETPGLQTTETGTVSPTATVTTTADTSPSPSLEASATEATSTPTSTAGTASAATPTPTGDRVTSPTPTNATPAPTGDGTVSPSPEVTDGDSTPGPTQPFTPTPLWTPSPTPTDTPLPTLTPLTTNTPTPEFLVLPGTPLPPTLSPIMVENAAQVSGLVEWQLPTITDLEWMPFTPLLAVSTYDSIKFYDVQSGVERRSLYPVGEGIVDIAFSPAGTWLVSGSLRGSEKEGYFSSLELWVGRDSRPLGILYDVPRGLSGITFSPDGTLFSAAFSSPVEELNSVEFWGLSSWAITDTLKTGTVLNITYSAGGNLLATTPDRYAIRVWDFREGMWLQKMYTSFTGAVNAMSFSPIGTVLASGHYDGAIRIWDAETGQLLLMMHSDSVVDSLAFSSDGRLIATGGGWEDNKVRIWSASTGILLRTLEGHSNPVTSVLFSPDGQYLISASYDGTLRLWGIRP